MIENMIQYYLKWAFKRYGIEGTEMKIKELYKGLPELKEKYLEEYYKILLK